MENLTKDEINLLTRLIEWELERQEPEEIEYVQTLKDLHTKLENEAKK